jgi:hypothetical protein
MKRNSVIMGAAFAAMASAALVLASANAEEITTGHEAAIKASSTVNPSQPMSTPSTTAAASVSAWFG